MESVIPFTTVRLQSENTSIKNYTSIILQTDPNGRDTRFKTLNLENLKQNWYHCNTVPAWQMILYYVIFRKERQRAKLKTTEYTILVIKPWLKLCEFWSTRLIQLTIKYGGRKYVKLCCDNLARLT